MFKEPNFERDSGGVERTGNVKRRPARKYNESVSNKKEVKRVTLPILVDTKVLNVDLPYDDKNRYEVITAEDLKKVGVLDEHSAGAGSDGSWSDTYIRELGYSPSKKKYFWEEENCICMSDNIPQNIIGEDSGTNPRFTRRFVDSDGL